MSKQQPTSSSLKPKKRPSRRWLNMMRIWKYGASNFTRNAWLTTAATAVMVVTLVIVFSSVMARNVFNDTINDLRQKLDISFYLNDTVTDEQRRELEDTLKSQEFVTNVTYISKDQAREAFITREGSDVAELQAIDALEGQNPFPASFRVNVTDPEQLESLDAVFESEDFVAAQNQDPSFTPTSQSSRRDGINNIARAAGFTERAGLVLSLLAVVISILIIFNTIRMAIFNRRDEIQMMKLIGADRNFIQGPFIVEAVMYGMLAALVTSAIVLPVLLTQSDFLDRYGVMVGPTLDFVRQYAALIVIALMFIGSFIGLVSSYLAIRRYLKV